MNRRDFLKSASGVATGAAMGDLALAQNGQPKAGTVRDKLWLFGVPLNCEMTYLSNRSTMTAVEGAHYLGVPNVHMIQVVEPQWAFFHSYESPLQQYTVALQSLKRFAWSLIGSGGYTTPGYRKEVVELARATPNCVGFYMDDFFYSGQKQKTTGRRAALTLDELKAIRQQTASLGKKINIWVTYYTRFLDTPLQDYLDLIDVLTFWTGNADELKNLESNFRKAETLGSHLKIALGCYFFDYHSRQPLTVDQMKHQCELGLEWLRQGKIEAMVFLGNCQLDQGFECVEWARNWIQKVGDIAV